jgi:hypothetical protein
VTVNVTVVSRGMPDSHRPAGNLHGAGLADLFARRITVVDQGAGSIDMTGSRVRRSLAEAARARHRPAPGT